MPSQTNSDDRVTILQGTLDLLILKTLVLGECHGQGIARSILRQSEEAFFVDHGSLYLALQRLEDKKWISAKWGVSANNRKARFYSLTAKGR
jgi:transcriptional regulator